MNRFGYLYLVTGFIPTHGERAVCAFRDYLIEEKMNSDF